MISIQDCLTERAKYLQCFNKEEKEGGLIR